MTTLREAAQQALEALEDMLGWQSLAPQTIQESAKGRAAALRAALEDGDKVAPTEPVAWYHVPHPGNGISPVVSMFPQHEPSLYAVAVPLFIRERQINELERKAEPVQAGCDHCNHPLYAATKCRSCGRVTG